MDVSFGYKIKKWLRIFNCKSLKNYMIIFLIELIMLNSVAFCIKNMRSLIKMHQRKYGAILSYINIFFKNAITFIYTPFLLRYIGQADYGLFQMTNSTIMSLSLLSMGFSSAYIKFYMDYKIKQDKDGMKKLNGLYLLLFICVGILAIIVGSFFVINVSNLFGRTLTQHELSLTHKLMSIMVINIALSFPSSVFDANILVNEKFVFQQTRQIAQSIIVPCIAMPLIFFGFGVMTIVYTQLIMTIFFLILNVRFCLTKLKMRFDFKNIQMSLLKDLAVFSFFIFLNQMVDLVNNNAPNFILGMIKGANDVATFAVALQIKNIFFMLSTTLSNVFVPRVNELVSSDTSKEILTNLMIKVGRIQMTILFFILGGFIVIGQYFIDIWAGSKNQSAYFLIILMVLPAIVPLCQNIGIEIQRAMNKHIFRSISYFLFAIVNIVVTIIGTKQWGLIGASLGYVVSLVCANGILMNWYYQRKMGLDMKKYWGQTLKVSIPFIVTTLFLEGIKIFIPVHSFVIFALFGIVYVLIYGLIYYKFIMSNEERNMVFKIK